MVSKYNGIKYSLLALYFMRTACLGATFEHIFEALNKYCSKAVIRSQTLIPPILYLK